MKRKFNVLFLVFMAMLCSTSLFAHDFEVDGIYYNITSDEDMTVEVTYRGFSYDSDDEYSGSVTIPESVTYEGKNYNVTSIDGYAFAECSSLISVTIPNSMKSISACAFAKSYSLASVIIPNSVTSIDGYAFDKCYSLTAIIIPNSVTSIGERAFQDCNALASVTIPNSVTSIGWGAFEDCKALASVIIGDGVKIIEGYAFYGCSGLASITIGNGVKRIRERAFENCTGLTSVTIPDNVTSIESNAFENCTDLTSVTIGNGVTSIGGGAFSDCSSLTSVTIPNSVTSIGGGAFSGCSSLTSVAIPNSVTSIGDNAFYGCTSLTSIAIPNSVTSIGWGAFSWCTSLTSITIPSSVTSIDEQAFDGTAWYNNQPDGVVYAGNVLYKCKGTLPDSTSVKVKAGTVSISPKAFYGHSWDLASITIPNSVKSIGRMAFYCCSVLSSVTIPNSVTSIGEHAFDDTAWYKNQPDGVIYVGKALYKYKGTMPSNTSFKVKAGTVSISPQAFYSCDGLTSISIPNSVISIGSEAFRYCDYLTSITIPESVTSIDWCAFHHCDGLTSVTIGKSVASIGDYAFGQCWGLTEIISYIPADKLFPIDDYVFEVPSRCVLTVPFGARKTYKATDGWRFSFSNIVEMKPEDTNIVLKEGVNFETANSFEAESVTYSRTLPNLMWNALYLPVDIPVSVLSENYDVAYFNDMHAYDRNGDGVVDEMNMEIFLIKEGTLRANYPYFIRAKNEAAKQLNLEFTDVTIQSTDDEYCSSVDVTSAFMTFELAGIYTRREGTELEDCYAITAEGAWAPIATNSYLNPFRLYLKMMPRPGSPVEISLQALRTIRISVQGEEGTTSIEETILGGQEPIEIYDLQGRRVTTPKKGLYIVNGKKVMF